MNTSDKQGTQLAHYLVSSLTIVSVFNFTLTKRSLFCPKLTKIEILVDSTFEIKLLVLLLEASLVSSLLYLCCCF